MPGADYFTRLAAINSVGPNVFRGSGEKIELVFICGRCNCEHDNEDDANDCCPPDVRERYKCPICRTNYRKEPEAEACCPGSTSIGPPMQCPICLQRAESFSDAADCCLHTHPTMTAVGRARAAEAVEAGTPWTEAIAANTNH
jgi:rubrerythrin